MTTRQSYSSSLYRNKLRVRGSPLDCKLASGAGERDEKKDDVVECAYVNDPMTQLLEESATQFKARLHSHLLTGRLSNSSLVAFASKFKSHVAGRKPKKEAVQQSCCTSNDVVNSARIVLEEPETYRRLANEAHLILANQTQSILKTSSQRRQLQSTPQLSPVPSENKRTLKRALKLTKTVKFSNSDAQSEVLEQPSKTNSTLQATFQQSETHFLKEIREHPERDHDNPDFIRVIKQEPANQALDEETKLENCQTSSKKRKFSDRACSNSEDQISKSGSQKRARLAINDVVEIYYYPKQEESDDDEDDTITESEESDGETSTESEESAKRLNCLLRTRSKCQAAQGTLDNEDSEESTYSGNEASDVMECKVKKSSPIESDDFETIFQNYLMSSFKTPKLPREQQPSCQSKHRVHFKEQVRVHEIEPAYPALYEEEDQEAPQGAEENDQQ